MVDQSYAMAENRIANEQNQLSNIEREKQRQKQQASAAAAARYQDGNVLVKVENFDGSNVMFSVTNVGSQGSLQPNFNTFSAYRTESGELVYKSESLLHLADTAGNTLQTMGIAELSSKNGNSLSISPGETRKFITSIASEVAPHAQLSLEFPAKVLNTEQDFTLSFSDSVAVATANVN